MLCVPRIFSLRCIELLWECICLVLKTRLRRSVFPKAVNLLSTLPTQVLKRSIKYFISFHVVLWDAAGSNHPFSFNSVSNIHIGLPSLRRFIVYFCYLLLNSNFNIWMPNVNASNKSYCTNSWILNSVGFIKFCAFYYISWNPLHDEYDKR